SHPYRVTVLHLSDEEEASMMKTPLATPGAPRRTFLRGAAVTAGAAALGFPTVVKAQGPITMRWQSTWPQKDIFHEYALDFAKKVNDMTGGDLKIDVLPAGAGAAGLALLHPLRDGRRPPRRRGDAPRSTQRTA